MEDVKHVKLGSPLKQSYADSTVEMYRQMKPRQDMEIGEVLEKDKDIIDENQNDVLVEEKNKL